MDESALLDLWDVCSRGGRRARAHRLAAFGAGRDVRDAPLGHWQAGLAAAWRQVQDGPLDARVDCPSCRGELEVSVPDDALPSEGPAVVTTDVATAHGPQSVRLPTARDLDDPLRSVEDLLVRLGLPDPPPGTVPEVERALAEADPGALLTIALTCPTCGTRFSEPLDLAAFVWSALEARVRAVLEQVAALAAAFGWGEADVLALPAARRAAYLALAAS